MKNENEYIQTMRYFVANRFLPIWAEFYPQADFFRTDYTENTDFHRLFSNQNYPNETNFLEIHLNRGIKTPGRREKS